MDEAENGIVVNNPHDGLFRKTWSDLENVRSFLQHYLPVDVLNLMDLNSLAICKDTFVEKELAAYYSDMLYAVALPASLALCMFCLITKAGMINMCISNCLNT